MFKKINLVLCFFIGFSQIVYAEEKIGNFTEKEIQVSGNKRSFLFFYPNDKIDTHLPLVVFFHGSNSNAKRQIDFTLLGRTAKENNFALVLAQTESTKWNTSKDGNLDLDYVDELIKNISKNYKIDSKKIFAFGHSNGGQFTYLLLEKRQNLFAGFAIFNSSSFTHKNVGSINPANPSRVVFIHGQKDEVFNWESASLEKSTKSGARDVLAKLWNCFSVAKSIDNNGEQYQSCTSGGVITSFSIPNLKHEEWPSKYSSKKPSDFDKDYNEIVWKILTN